MKYRKFFIKIMLVICFLSCITGCSQQNSNQNHVATTQITEIETEITATGIVSYSRVGNNIDLKADNQIIQRIKLDDIPANADIILKDYDFDGHDDIFISEIKGSPRGIYYHYDIFTEQFVPWEALNQVGWKMELQENHTLLMICYNHYGSTHMIYHWDDARLIPEEFIDFYFKSDYEIADYYQYADNGTKILYGRKLFQPDSGICIQKIEYPVYFEVHENEIAVMKQGHSIQTIEHVNLSELVRDLNERAENDSVVFLERGSVIEAPEKYLETYDYDFDGYDDLFIPTSFLGTRTGIFYHFDPETEQFLLWEELNQIGISLYPESNSKQLTSYCFETSGMNTYTYTWNEQMTHVNLIQRKHSYETEDNHMVTEIYQIDENGNEILAETELSTR